jgi:membrane-associated protease RseP (regulator of RpoE activity)
MDKKNDKILGVVAPRSQVKILEYQVLSGTTLFWLVQEVNKHITMSWKPLGGICAVKTNEYEESWMFYQAIVKYKED